MAHKTPPPCPKGTRHAGSGRKPGTPNRVNVAARALVAQMVGDPFYQHQLRRDFRKRKVHPTIEALVWAYHLGKPATVLELTGNLELSQRFEDERQKLRSLGLAELEALAAESQALVDRAFERAMSGRLLEPAPQVGRAAPSHLVSDVRRTSTTRAGGSQVESGGSVPGAAEETGADPHPPSATPTPPVRK
jgi:hypothetical protein